MPLTGDLCPDWELNWQPLVHRPVLNPLSYAIQALSSPLNHPSNLHSGFCHHHPSAIASSLKVSHDDLPSAKCKSLC